MKGKSKKKENKRSVFQLCFPCIGKQTFSCDDVMHDSFGREFTEYEYVIENLAIRRAPKVLLDSALPAKKSKSKYGQTEKVPVRNFGTLVERTPSPDVICGPMIEEQPSLMTPPNEKQMKTLNPTWTDYNPFKFTPPVEKQNTPRQNFADAILLENTRQKKTVAQVYPVKNDLKVLADVHKTEPTGPEDKIPCEIKETIAALKNARLPTTHKVRRARNHRTVLRGDSTTSFEPDTACSSEITDSNVSDITLKKFKNYLVKHKAYDDKLIEENDSILEQAAKDQKIATTETSEDLNVDKNVGPKWRIIINKHAGENKT